MSWRPIETAPKDGRLRLLYWPTLPEKQLDAHIAICNHNGGPFRHPTHWMPLPEPPAEQSALNREGGNG